MSGCKIEAFRIELERFFNVEMKDLKLGNAALGGAQFQAMIDAIVEIASHKQSQKRLFNRSNEELTQQVLYEVQRAHKAQVNALLHDHIVIEQAVDYISRSEDPMGALEAFLVGKIRTFSKTGGLAKQEGSRLSVDTLQQTERGMAEGQLLDDLTEANVLDIFRDGKMEDIILDVGYRILNDPDFKPTNPKEQAAEKIANIIIKNWEARSKISNDNGAVKSKAADSFEEIFGLMGHDQATLYKTDKDEWIAFMKDNMDTENTIYVNEKGELLPQTPDSIDDYLDGLWQTIVSGENMIYRGESYQFGNTGMNVFVQRFQNIIRKAFSGKRNVGAKESTPSQIKFKSGKAAYEYSQKYIKKSLVENVINQTIGQTNNNVLLRELGTNPENSLITMYRRAREITKNRLASANDKLNKLKGQRDTATIEVDGKKITVKKHKENLKKEIDFANKRLRKTDPASGESLPTNMKQWMAELDGSANVQEAGVFANHLAFYSRSLRIIQVMSKLGQATLSAFGDIAFQVGALTNSGMSGIEATFRTIGNIFDGIGGQSKTRRKYANSLGVGVQMFKGSLFAKVGIGQGNYPGMLTRAQNHFFKFNLMSWWNDSHAIGMSFTFMNHLASHKKLSFDDLAKTEPGKQVIKTLEDYRIGAKEWDILRKYGIDKMEAEEVISVKDLRFDGDLKKDIKSIIKEGDDSRFNDRETVIKGEAKRYEFNPADYLETIRRRYITMVNDTSRNGIMIPGAWEQAFMKGGSKAGTVLGEAVRQFMLFKTFPVTVVRKALGNKTYSKVHKGEANVAGAIQLVIGSAILGALAIQTKEMAKGRSPRKMLGDNNLPDPRFVLDSVLQGGSLGIYGDMLIGNYQGRSPMEQLGGPGFNTLQDVLEIIHTTVSDTDKTPREVMKFIKNNMPYQNLFYGKMIQDYLIYNHLMELSNPGYLRREERRIMRDRDQRYFVPRSIQE